MRKVEEKSVGGEGSPLDEIARRGAQRMIEAALEVEVEQYLSQLREHRDERGHAQVVRNGRAQERAVTVGSGLRILEHHGFSTPYVVTGGWRSTGYASEFLQYAGPLTDDDAKGYRNLLDAVFGELALDLPGLYGPVGLTHLFPVPAATLRAVVEALNEPALASAWGDDTTLGWVYQYWNDPEREALDAKLAGGGKIEPHEIASKTQMFTERYMVEWLLQNSLGLTWLCICKKNGWTADAERVLPVLEERRAAWRARREAGEVALDVLLPIEPGLESDWKYYVPQPLPKDALDKAPRSVAEVKLLDPACGSGHFLVIAFGLLAGMHDEEARHRGETWSPADVAARIVEKNLHGIDIDPRAIQIAAAALWLRARLHAPGVRLARMNLVAPVFRLAQLPDADPARVALAGELAELGVPRATTGRLVDALKGVDHLGTLLRVDRELGALLDQIGETEGPLLAYAARIQRARLEERVAAFLDAHAAESDLGLRLEGEQLAAGVRFIELAKEGRYDVVVGNPPYQAISKTARFEYVVRSYPRGKADLYAAFLERGLELAREGGLSALVTMRGWMFLGKGELRKHLLGSHELVALVDLDSGAFDEVSAAQVILSVACSVFRRGRAGGEALALRPTPAEDRASQGMTNRKRAGLLAQSGRYDFDPNRFAVIAGQPIVYWWTKEFLERYGQTPKLGNVSPARATQGLYNNIRFTRWWHEVAANRICSDPNAARPWTPFTNGSDGAVWREPLRLVARWGDLGMEAKLSVSEKIGTALYRFANEQFFFRDDGVAFSMIGAEFGARIVPRKGIFGDKGRCVFAAMPHECVGLLNSTTARFIMQSLNPSISFQAGDVNRIPQFPVADAEQIGATLDRAFAESEGRRDASRDFTGPGSSPWRHAQDWAQRAVDRSEGAPLPPYEPTLVPPDPEAHVSFAIGVALGRLGASGEGLLNTVPEAALPAGILLVGPDEAYPDSLPHPSLVPLLAAWESFTPARGRKPPLRDWLRKDFFAYHKALYENRPIYFPLSSEKKTFVAWVSIHRWTATTLTTLLADHLSPVLRRLDAELSDVNAARANPNRAVAIAADRRHEAAKRLRDELAAFIATVTEINERGAPAADAACPGRRDAPFVMDLDDGVMVNSAALWPLLAPQWADPKKWWKQLCLADGRKDFDWAHLAKRYFPGRVDDKCRRDPSLAVAHGCFWKYHPATAFAWELRLQDAVRAGFTIDEAGSDEARAAWLRAFPQEAEAARERERVRRERRAARGDAAEADEDDAEAAPESGEAGDEEGAS